MRLAAFRRLSDEPGDRLVGLVVGRDSAKWRIHPFPVGTDLVGLLAADRERREALADDAAAHDGLTLAEVVLLPPVYPVAMRDFLTFEAHVEGMERGHGNPGAPAEWYDAPVFLFMAPHAVTGPYDDVIYPPDTERLDFELEIAALVVKDVRNVTPEEARDAIGGYCVMNDWSARDVQGKEMKLKLGPSKGKDFATTIGPWVVTADEFEASRDADGFLDLGMEVRVNGRPGRRRPVRPHGLVLRAAGLARLARFLGEGRRGARLWHLLLRLAGRVLGPHRSLVPPPLQVGRRRGDDHRATSARSPTGSSADTETSRRSPPRGVVRGSRCDLRPPVTTATRRPAWCWRPTSRSRAADVDAALAERRGVR